MVHAALLLLMLEAANADLVFTISLKRSTPNLLLSTNSPADYPIFGSFSTELRSPRHVRFHPNSDNRADIAGCLKSPNNGRQPSLTYPFCQPSGSALVRTGAAIGIFAHRQHRRAQ